MSELTLTYTATANTVAPSAQYNLNNSEIETWSTTIDHSNTVNSTGFWASDIEPLTLAEATFGATATGIGYKFLANDATATPLIVSGVSGQSADIFDVTLTSGGTKAIFVPSGGGLAFGATGLPSAALPAIAGDAGATIGMAFNVPTGSTSGYRWFLNNVTTLMQLSASGALALIASATSTITPSTHTYNYQFLNNNSHNTGIGCSNSVTINTIGGTVCLITDETNIDAVSVDASGNMGLAGTLHQTSRRELKQRIEYVDPEEALQVVLATKIARYDFISEEQADKLRHASFIADETPWQLSGGPGYEHADPQKTASYALAAIAALHAKVVALEGKLPAA